MRKLLGLCAGALALSGQAFAADMPVKAASFAYPVDTSGWYFGLDSGARVARASTSGNGLFVSSLVSGDVTADGGYVGGAFGYIRGDQHAWTRFHFIVDYQNITGSVPVAGANANIASRWSASGEVDFGGDYNPITLIVAALGNVGVQGFTFPTFTPPTLNGVTAAAPRNYLGGGFQIYGLSGNFGQVGGVSESIGAMLKAGAIWQSVSTTTGKANGGAFDTYASVTWSGKGVELDNLFGSSGGPTLRGSANLKTTYSVGWSYLFGVPTVVASR